MVPHSNTVLCASMFARSMVRCGQLVPEFTDSDEVDPLPPRPARPPYIRHGCASGGRCLRISWTRYAPDGAYKRGVQRSRGEDSPGEN